MSAKGIITPLPPWKHVAITGAAQGLGRALAEICSGVGMAVSMMDNNAWQLAETAAALRGTGGCAIALLCDVRSSDSVRDAFAQALLYAGPPDAVICCAAIGDSEWKRGFHAAFLERVLSVNLMGIARCMESSLPQMHANGGGTLVLISSLLDARGYAGTASYSISKAALRSLADSARVLLRSSGIRVVLVRPGFMRTAMTAGNRLRMPGMVSPEDAARRILRGIARGKSVISSPRWMALAAAIAPLAPRSAFGWLVQQAMKRDGEADALRYRPLPQGGIADGSA